MTLYLVSTPIGNLEDISLRALATLKKVNFICAENPRHSSVLTQKFAIKTPLKPLSLAIGFLKQGNDVALVSEAGTPGISDPGAKIVKAAIEISGCQIAPIPGASALIAAFSATGILGSKFLFLGFLPLKKKRHKALLEIIKSKIPVVFYESPHRIIKTLKSLPKAREVVVARELTKIYENFYRGSADQVVRDLEESFKGRIKGEFTVVVKAKEKTKAEFLKL